MIINKLQLNSFGKYHEQEIPLQPGMNVIYGQNEAGKTTMKDFILAMLYGVERSRGTAAKTDEYTRHAPLQGGRYAGSMELERDGAEYTLDRNFQKNQKEVHLYQKHTGREITLEEGQGLRGVLLDMDRNTYENTLCISSDGAQYKSNLYESFRTYLTNLNETHDGVLNLKETYQYLNQQKRKWKLKELEEELESVKKELTDQDLDKELAALSVERQRLEDQLLQASGAENDQAEKPESSESPGESKKKTSVKDTLRSLIVIGDDEKKNMNPQLRQILSFIKILFVFGLMAIIFLLIFMLPISLNYKGWLCFIVIAVVAYIYIRSLVLTWKKRKAKKTNKKEPKKKTAEGNEILAISRSISELQVKENQLLQEIARQQDLQFQCEQIRDTIQQGELEIQAIDLAITTMQELSGDIYDQYAPALSRRVSNMVTTITDGAYTDVRIDEKLNVQVRKNDSYVGVEFLSTGTVEQLYLAVRLAVAQEMSDMGMPLLLDDGFAYYDDKRFKSVLQCITDIGVQQVILFTANNRLADILDQTSIDYNYIEL